MIGRRSTDSNLDPATLPHSRQVESTPHNITSILQTSPLFHLIHTYVSPSSSSSSKFKFIPLHIVEIIAFPSRIDASLYSVSGALLSGLSTFNASHSNVRHLVPCLYLIRSHTCIQLSHAASPTCGLGGPLVTFILTGTLEFLKKETQNTKKQKKIKKNKRITPLQDPLICTFSICAYFSVLILCYLVPSRYQFSIFRPLALESCLQTSLPSSNKLRRKVGHNQPISILHTIMSMLTHDHHPTIIHGALTHVVFHALRRSHLTPGEWQVEAHVPPRRSGRTLSPRFSFRVLLQDLARRTLLYLGFGSRALQ